MFLIIVNYLIRLGGYNMIIYNSLESLIEDLTPYQWARFVYKSVNCGPWVTFKCSDGDSTYYDGAKATDRHWINTCVSITVGSIVEGSDVECSPLELNFPFSDVQLDAVLKEINSEAEFYWLRDNSTQLKILVGDVSYFLAETHGELEWVEKPPKEIEQALIQFTQSDEYLHLQTGDVTPIDEFISVQSYYDDMTY